MKTKSERNREPDPLHGHLGEHGWRESSAKIPSKSGESRSPRTVVGRVAPDVPTAGSVVHRLWARNRRRKPSAASNEQSEEHDGSSNRCMGDLHVALLGRDARSACCRAIPYGCAGTFE